MKKYILATAITAMMSGAVMAQDVENQEDTSPKWSLFDTSERQNSLKNGFVAGIELSRLHSKDYENGKPNVFSFNLGYKLYLTEKVSTEVFLKKGHDDLEPATLDTYGIGFGYDYKFNEKLVLTPKIGFSNTTIKSKNFSGGMLKEKASSVILGIEFKPTDSNLSYDLSVNRMKIKGEQNPITALQVGLKYHF